MYEEELEIKETDWPASFALYWMKNIHTKIDRMAWWTVKKLGWKVSILI
jgi:hypothetical protein